jgi:Ca2+-transporting ATPase
VLGAFALAHLGLGYDDTRAVTVSFLALAFAQLWHVFNMRGPQTGMLANDITRNPYVWGALALCGGLLLAAVYVPPLRLALQVVHPGTAGWLLALGASLVPLGTGQLALTVARRRAADDPSAAR